MTRILVVDDLPALRKQAAQACEEVVPKDLVLMEASNGTDALRLSETNNFDLLVLDIAMPDISGIRVAESIWQKSPTCKIIFWSQFHNESYVRAISKILPDEAIHGYVLKGENDENLVNGIRSVLLHENPFIDPIVRGVHLKLKSKSDALSDIEYETLIDVCVGLTDRAMATRRHISVRGVQKRISSLLDKLLHGEAQYFKETTGVEILNPRTRLVCVAFRRGLILPEDLDEPESEMIEWISKQQFRTSS